MARHWIKRRGIKPQPNETRTKKVKALKNKTIKKAVKQQDRAKQIKSIAFAISRNIGKNGYEGNHFYSEVVNDGRMAQLKADLSALLKKDIEIEIIDLTKLR